MKTRSRFKLGWLWLILGLLFITILIVSLYTDIGGVGQSFFQFSWKLFPLVLSLAFLNYGSRFLRWEYYLKILKIKIDRISSAKIFFSGLLMAITPAKAGELFKSYLLKSLRGIAISRSAPAIFAERLTDLMAVFLLAMIGFTIFRYGIWILLVCALIVLGFLIILGNKSLMTRILVWLSKNRFVKKYSQRLNIFYKNIYQLIKIGPLFSGTLIATIAWAFECIAFFIVLQGLGIETSILASFFIYALATLAGAISMLPGGLGVTEAGLAGILVYLSGTAKEPAVAAAFIIRLATLWLAVLVGLTAVIIFKRKY